MSHTVRKCPTQFENVPHSLEMSQTVWKCLRQFENDRDKNKLLRNKNKLFRNIFELFRNISVLSRTFPFCPEHNFAPGNFILSRASRLLGCGGVFLENSDILMPKYGAYLRHRCCTRSRTRLGNARTFPPRAPIRPLAVTSLGS